MRELSHQYLRVLQSSPVYPIAGVQSQTRRGDRQIPPFLHAGLHVAEMIGETIVELV